MVFILSALWSIGIRGLRKLYDGRDWLRGEVSLVLLGRAMLSKSLIQFSLDGWGYVSSLLFGLRANYGGGKEDNDNLLQKAPYIHCHTQCPWPCSRAPLTHPSTRDSWTLTGKSGSVSCGVIVSSSRVMVHTGLVPSESLLPQSCVSSGSSMVGLTAEDSTKIMIIKIINI